jgi:hypothetical protein
LLDNVLDKERQALKSIISDSRTFRANSENCCVLERFRAKEVYRRQISRSKWAFHAARSVCLSGRVFALSLVARKNSRRSSIEGCGLSAANIVQRQKCVRE